MATMKKEKGILHGERLDDSTKSKFEYWYWTKVIKQSMLTIKLYGKEQKINLAMSVGMTLDSQMRD